ncbi:MAG: hypothetical protein RL264_2671 [Bacteroidota bacterium]|jgi:hypothetical protein
MKTINLILTFLTITSILISSCSVQKRYHRKGFNVNWNQSSIGQTKGKNVKEEYEKTDLNNSETVICSESKYLNNSIAKGNDNTHTDIELISIENTSVDTDWIQSEIESESPIILNQVNIRLEKNTRAGEMNITKKSKKSDLVNEDEEKEYSWTVAIILCFFLGALGIHRFYLGHIGIGVLYLLTGGLCGIGVLIDFILLLTGGLKPKTGSYKENDKGL